MTWPIEDLEIAKRLAVALAVGAFLGVERQRHRAAGRPSFAGLRTFTLISLFGAVSVWISLAVFPWFVAAAFLGLASIVALSYHALARHEEELGTTTEFAAFVAFGLGAISFAGYPELAVALAVVVTALLSEKTTLHGLAGRLSEEDLQATLKFAILALVVLPLLPDRVYPFLGTEALNPRTVWLMVVLISAVSFAGYVLIKWLGAKRGIGLTGLLGGLVSSTAVTLSFTRRSRETPALARSFALAVVLAYSVMALRVGVLLALVNPRLLARLAAPLGAIAAAGALASWVLYRGKPRSDGDGVEIANPFRLGPAVRFGALFAAVLFLVDLAQRRLPSAGVYAAGALGGLVDADAAALSVGHLAAPTRAAALVVLVAVASNTVGKTLFAAAFGNPRFAGSVAAAAAAMLGAGGVALLAISP